MSRTIIHLVLVFTPFLPQRHNVILGLGLQRSHSGFEEAGKKLVHLGRIVVRPWTLGRVVFQSCCVSFVG